MPIQLVEATGSPLLARPYYEGGDPGPIVAALAHVPELLEVAMPFLGVALSPSAIPWRTKEIVILRTSAQLECRYCVQSHTPVALDSGLSRDEVVAVRGSMPADTTFTETSDVALIHWVDEVAAGRGSVSEPLRDDLRAHYEEHEVVELTLLVGATMMLNRFCTALELPTSPEVIGRLTDEGLA